MRTGKHIIIALLLLATTGCKKLVEIPAPDMEIIRSEVFEDNGTALAAMMGVYNKMVNASCYGGSFTSLNVTLGAYADELIVYNLGYTALLPYYNNGLVTNDPSTASVWSSSYNIIYTANAVIEGVTQSSKLTQSSKNQFTGEALFIRSFIHFYLVNLYGDVPYINSTDYATNSRKSRMPVQQVYDNIIADLKQAQLLLPDDYPTAERIRANKGAATALLARVYLYNRQWSEAETEATTVITKATQYQLPDSINNAFLKESKEAIWQLYPQYGATGEGQAFVLLTQPTRISLRTDFIDSTFSSNDLRKQKWLGSVTQGFSTWYFPYKYKVRTTSGQPTEYSMMLRLAEQYLVRAEAKAQQNKLIEAAADVNVIRDRAGLNDTTSSTKEGLLTIVEKERRAEFFTEWGHRFFDLKRWGKLDAVLGQKKSGWNSTDVLWPIPQNEILANRNLTQNIGY